jgi:hypothetical protein
MMSRRVQGSAGIKPLASLVSAPNRFTTAVILLGLLIRLLLIPFSLHVDPQFTGDIATIPEAVMAWNSPNRANRGYFIYPPLTYYTFSIYILDVASPFTTDLLNKQIFGLEARYNWLSSPEVFRNVFVLKVWYLLFDLGIMILLWGIFREEPGKARTVLIFWTLNPLVLYSAYFHGQFDLIPLFFVVLSMFFCKKGQATWATFCMGIGACYKNFPFPFMLLLVMMMAKTWPSRIKLILVGTLPYILLYITSLENYKSLGTSLSGRFFVGGYEIGNGAQIYFFSFSILLFSGISTTASPIPIRTFGKPA